MRRKKRRQSTRKPFIYRDGDVFRLQVGKVNLTFTNFDWAVRYGNAHYEYGNKNNWQSYRQTKNRMSFRQAT